jgi:Mg-chelatase subunit ChlD
MSGFTETNTNTNTNASALLESATLSFHNIKTEVENEAEVVAHKVAVERSNALETETEVTENIQINKIQVTQVHIAQVNEIQHFGMLKIQVATLTKVLTKMLRIVMLIDLSGSMDEKCKDNRSQIHHMRTVTMNLIRELHKFKDSETNIQFIVKGFEDKVHHILDIPNLLSLSEEQIAIEIIPQIAKLKSLGWTNLEAALKEGRKCVHKVGEEEIKNMIVVITDGDANKGETRPAELRKLLPSNCANFILGLGVNYDAKILQKISDGENKHINDPESAGNCVGEIIHKFLYEALTNVEIIVENGRLYNYRNNTWTTHLAIPSIASEETKNFSIMSSTPDTVIIKIRCLMNGTPFEHIISENEKSDLTMFQFRQAVQEAMYKAKELEQLRSEMGKSNYTGDIDYIIFGLKDEDDLYSSDKEIAERKAQEAKDRNKQFNKVQTEFKAEMKQLLIKMLRYMNDNDLNNDAFFKTLCMDLKVTMDNIGKKNAEVYINSRITSQGRQETYTCDAIDEPEDDHRQSFTRLTRQTACNNNNNNSDSDSDGDDYICRAAMSSSRQTAAINSDSDDEDVQKAAPCSNSNNIQANSEEEEKEEEEGEEEEEDELLATFNKSIRQKATFASPYASPQKLGLMRGVSSQQEDAEEEDEDQ